MEFLGSFCYSTLLRVITLQMEMMAIWAICVCAYVYVQCQTYKWHLQRNGRYISAEIFLAHKFISLLHIVILLASTRKKINE